MKIIISKIAIAVTLFIFLASLVYAAKPSAPFNLRILNESNGTSTVITSLEWTPPTTTTDGEPIADIFKYTVYYVTQQKQIFTKIVDVAGTITTYTVSGRFATGVEHCFAVSAWFDATNESGYSNVVCTIL